MIVATSTRRIEKILNKKMHLVTDEVIGISEDLVVCRTIMGRIVHAYTPQMRFCVLNTPEDMPFKMFYSAQFRYRALSMAGFTNEDELGVWVRFSMIASTLRMLMLAEMYKKHKPTNPVDIHLWATGTTYTDSPFDEHKWTQIVGWDRTEQNGLFWDTSMRRLKALQQYEDFVPFYSIERQLNLPP